MSTYRSHLEALFKKTGGGIKLGLGRMQELLRALGNPQDRIPWRVVVAGTNGKGSTCSMLASALSQAGHRVGLYTSPHLLRFAERIRVANEEISVETVLEGMAAIEEAEARAGIETTFFECATALCLWHFAQQGVEVAVLEVGMGGRLDATNAFDKSLAVITPVGMDHQQFLGGTLGAIAREKAGILWPNGTAVVAPQAPEASAAIQATAQSLGCAVLEATPVGTDWVLPGGPALGAHPQGAYQRLNVGTVWSAVQALRSLGLSCSDAAVAEGIAQARWPGRFQWLDGATLLDAAHNLHGMQALLEALQHDPLTAGGRPIHAVFSALRDKPGREMASLLRSRVQELILCPLPLTRSHTEETLPSIAPGARVAADVSLALQMARESARRDDGVVLVAGSIFLVAEAMAAMGMGPRDPLIPF